MDLDVLDDRIKELVAREARVDAVTLEPSAELLSSGLVDSVAMVRVAALIERETGITIPDRDVNDENFGTLRSIRAYVESRQAPA